MAHAGMPSPADCGGGGMMLDDAIRRLDFVQAELTIHPEGCPEPWRTWMIEAHEAMCEAVQEYRKQKEEP